MSTSAVITTNQDFAGGSKVFGNAKMTTALLERLTHHCHIVERRDATVRGARESSRGLRTD